MSEPSVTTGPTDGPTPASAGSAVPVRRASLILLALAGAALAMVTLQSIVVPILPSLARDMNVSTADATWMLTANLITSAVFTSLLGRFGDAWSKKRVVMVALGFVAAGSLLAAVASSFPLLLAARVLQGVGTGGVLPLAIGIVRDELPAARQASAVALISATMGIGGGLGIVAAGVSAAVASWQSVFWAAAVLSLAAIVLLAWLVPDSQTRAPGAFDLPGALIMSGWLICLLLAVSKGAQWGWASPTIVGLLVAAVALFVGWIYLSSVTLEPLVDMRVMRNPSVLAANLSGVLVTMAMFGAFLLMTTYLQTPASAGYGFSATTMEAGLLMLPSTLGSVVGAPLASRLLRRSSAQMPLIIGSLTGAAAFGGLSVFHGQPWQFLVASFALGIGFGLSFAAMPMLINPAVPRSRTAVANGVNSVMRMVGGAVGSAVVAAILSASRIPGSTLPTESAFRTAFLVSASCALLAGVVAIVVPGWRRGRPAPAGSAALEAEAEAA